MTRMFVITFCHQLLHVSLEWTLSSGNRKLPWKWNYSDVSLLSKVKSQRAQQWSALLPLLHFLLHQSLVTAHMGYCSFPFMSTDIMTSNGPLCHFSWIPFFVLETCRSPFSSRNCSFVFLIISLKLQRKGSIIFQLYLKDSSSAFVWWNMYTGDLNSSLSISNFGFQVIKNCNNSLNIL